MLVIHRQFYMSLYLLDYFYFTGLRMSWVLSLFVRRANRPFSLIFWKAKKEKGASWRAARRNAGAAGEDPRRGQKLKDRILPGSLLVPQSNTPPRGRRAAPRIPLDQYQISWSVICVWGIRGPVGLVGLVGSGGCLAYDSELRS